MVRSYFEQMGLRAYSALIYNPQGARARGRLNTTWRSTIAEESGKIIRN